MFFFKYNVFYYLKKQVNIFKMLFFNLYDFEKKINLFFMT